MKLNQLSNESQKDMMIQAYDHLFFANNFQENMKRVLDFEQQFPFPFLYTNQVLSYLEFISNGRGYPYFIAQNISEYVLFLRDSAMNLSKEDKKIRFDLANQVIDQNRIYRSQLCYTRLYLIRFNECVSFAELFKAYFEKTDMIEKNVREFVPSIFLYSCQLLSGNHIITNPNQFLHYCHYLANVQSPLLDDPIFFDSFFTAIEKLPVQDLKRLKR